MIIVKLTGGLGNQMFQYALGRTLSLKFKTELGFDTSFYQNTGKVKRQYDLSKFNIAGRVLSAKDIPPIYHVSKIKIIRKLSQVVRKILFKNKGLEKSFSFNPSVLSLGPNVYLEGYWQSPKYFSDFKEVIRRDFTLRNQPRDNVKTLAREISNTKSLCIHVRRGDYIGNKTLEAKNDEYYQNGIKYISSKTSIEKIYVFSDDIAWCRDNLKFNFPTIFVDDSYAGESGEEHMYLMSKCHNFIIANSSFSWWAAWLSEYPEKIVVAPQKWFLDKKLKSDDLLPENWIKI